MSTKLRSGILLSYVLLALLAALVLPKLRFAFDFASFFPKGDPDLAFFQEFIAEFESDDNFMLVAVQAEEGRTVFDTGYLNRFHEYTLQLQDLPRISAAMSLSKMRSPIKTPFGITSVPLLHLDDPERLPYDSARVMQDERFVYNLISPDASTMAIILRSNEEMTLGASDSLMANIRNATAASGFDESRVHYLGRAYFQSELVAMQQREVAISTVIAGILVTLILALIYRRWGAVLVTMSTVGLSLLLFFGLLAWLGRPLDAIAALYPVLMVIVGTSDVIHLMTKYVDELDAGRSRREALRNTVREIGLATFLTSATTAIGFATLLTSKVGPIRAFGVNAALGVLVAYIVTMTFAMALLTFLDARSIMRSDVYTARWNRWLASLNLWVKSKSRSIIVGTGVVLLLCLWGISMVTTNYRIMDNLPRDAKITEDFEFFERKFTGFRPVEFAVFVQPPYEVDDLEVLQEMDKVEQAMRRESALRAVTSPTALVKSIQQAMTGGKPSDYKLPEDSIAYARIRPMLSRVPSAATAVLVNEAGDKARISSRALDVGSDSIRSVIDRVEAFAKTQVDSSIIQLKATGTGLLLDKNSVYVRESLLYGLGVAVLLIAFLMALLFRNWKVWFVAMVPNLFPLLLAGALLGWLNIELEAGISIIFAVIFGIAVDDTIHFLAKYRLVRGRGVDIETAMAQTFRESGKAIVLTTIILFFGFLVMLFSKHPPSVTVGLLISITLGAALVADLLLLPPLLRKMKI